MSQDQNALVVVTGATSGLGAAYAIAYARRGASLVITGRRADELARRREELLAAGATHVEVLVGDLGTESTANDLVALIERSEVDVLVNNAGFGAYGTIAAPDLPRLRSMIRVHAELPLRTCAAALPAMVARRSGVIINVASLAGRVAVPGSAVYVATKAHLERFSETLAIESAPDGVVVQALLPGYVRTEFHRDVEDYEQKRVNQGLIRWMDADAVVGLSLRAVARARRRIERRAGRPFVPRRRDVVVIPGAANRILASLAPFVPRTLVYRAAASRTPM